MPGGCAFVSEAKDVLILVAECIIMHCCVLRAEGFGFLTWCVCVSVLYRFCRTRTVGFYERFYIGSSVVLLCWCFRII